MDFDMSDRQREWRDRVISFMKTHIEPAVPTYRAQMNDGTSRWKVVPVVEELKKILKAQGVLSDWRDLLQRMLPWWL